MTKVQMKNAALALAVDMKASKKLQDALADLFEAYTKNSKLDSVQRDKVITIDGAEFQWCNRHEVYEPITNFKNSIKNDKIIYAAECRLATKYWSYLGTRVKEAQAKLDKMIEDELYDNIKGCKTDVDTAKANRGGRYDFESNQLQFPEVADFNYDMEAFYTDAEVASL